MRVGAKVGEVTAQLSFSTAKASLTGGYVRQRAEEQGVELALDYQSASSTWRRLEQECGANENRVRLR